MLKWLVTSPAGWATLAVGAVVGLTVAYANLASTSETAAEAQERLKEAEEELSSTRDELTGINDKIAEIRSKGGELGISDQAELDRLEAERKILEDQVRLLELKKELAADKSNREAVKTVLGNKKEAWWTDSDDFIIKEVTGYADSDNDGTFESNTGAEYGYTIGDYEKQIEEIDKEISDWESKPDSKKKTNKLVKLEEKKREIQDNLDESKLKIADIYLRDIELMEQITGDDAASVKAREKLQNEIDFLEKYIYSKERLAKIKFDDFIKAPDNKAVADGFKDIQEDGEVTAQEITDLANKFSSLSKYMLENGITAEILAAEYSNVSDASKSTEQNTDELRASLTELEAASNNLKPLGSAFKELSDDGYITINTLKEIKDAADLSSEEWVEYEDRLLNAKAGSSEFNQIMSDLTYKILDNTFAGKDLNAVTERQIAATLRENGVVNANVVAHEWLAKAKAKEKVASMELVKGSNLDIKALAEEASACNVTENAYLELVAKEIIFNRNDLDVKDKVAKLNQIAIAAGVAGISIDNLNSKFGTQADKNKYVEESGGKVGYREVSTPEKSTVGWSLPYEPKLSSPLRELPQGIVEYELPDGTKTTDFSEYYASIEMGKLSERITNATSNITIPDFSGSDKDKNEALDNYLKEAERRYEVHQDEEAYIKDLQYAYSNLTKEEEERLDIADKINEAYKDLADNKIKDVEHQIDLVKELQGDDADVTEYYDQIQKIASDEATRLRKAGYDDNSDEIQAKQKTWWDAQNSKIDFYNKQHENIIRDIEHARDMALEQNPYVDTTSYYEQLQDEYHKRAEYLRSLDPEKHKEEIQKLQQAWWDAQKSIADWSYSNSERWISERNTYNDWDLYNDNEIAAWERVLKRFQTEFPNELEKIKEIEQKIFDARKDAMEKAISDIDDYIDARNAYNDWDAYGDNEVKAVQRQTKIIEDAYKQRLLSYEEYVDRLEEQTQRIYSLGKGQVDKHLSNIDKYIDARNHYNDWDSFNDSEIEAIKRQCAVLDEAYRLNLISLEEYTEKSAEYTQKLYSVAKENIIKEISEKIEDYEEVKELESSQYSSLQTLLQSYYDVSNAISEAQHEINKELKASQSMYEYLNEDTRELLFNQGDYNDLNEELLNIQAEADELQKKYQEDILNANAETIAEITSQYQMQYETMMKKYEIAKAELDVAKKRQKLDNVLAERNTRMFINGQWQWVAKTQDVINAQNELAEAEIEKKKQEATLEQTESINKFTEQINSIETDLKQIRKKWSDMQEMLNGESDEVAEALKMLGGKAGSFSKVLTDSTSTLSTIISSDLPAMSTNIGTIVSDLQGYSNAIQALIDKLNEGSSGRLLQVGADGNAPAGATIGDIIVTAGGNYKIVSANTPGATLNPESGHWSVKVSSSSSGSSSSGSSGKTVQVGSDGNAPKGTNVGDVVKTAGGDYLVVPYGTEGSTYNPVSGLSSIKIDEKNAAGTRYTSGGMTLMGEEGFEAYISNTGRFIPIARPTLGNIGAGGIVFNREQMANLRNLWDWSNIGKMSSYVSSSNANSQSTVVDNSIHINGLTVGEQGNEDWINGLRRYVMTHK